MFRISSTYGTTVKNHRREMGLTQARLSRLAGVSQQEISNIERGKLPSGEALWKINEVLGIAMFDALTPNLQVDDYDRDLIEDYLQKLR